MSTFIRAATAKDVPQLMELHYRVFTPNTNYLLLLGRSFLKRLFLWYCTAGDAFMLVAEGPSGIAGYIAVNQGSYYLALRANWPHALLGFVAHPMLIFHPSFGPRFQELLGARVKDVGTPAHRACLAYLAVDPAMGGKGGAPVLIRAALSECRSRGWYEVVTAMHTENLRARYLYAMLGFESASGPDSEGLVSVRIDLHPRAAPVTLETQVQEAGRPAQKATDSSVNPEHL